MSWLFSQALVEASLAEGYLDGEPFAPSSTTPTPQAFLYPDKTTGTFDPSRFGMTCARLTEDLGHRLWTWSVVASPVRTSVLPGKARASTGSKADSGWKWRASFAKWSPATSTWRTRQVSLLGDSEEFSETWPRWGSMRDGECLALTTPMLATSGKESGFWPTIRASDSERGGRGDLLQAVRGNTNSHFKKYPTPRANDSQKRGNFNPAEKRNGLAGAIRSESHGLLNPNWVEWLMGWPIGWTALQPLETDRFREWQQQHGKS